VLQGDDRAVIVGTEAADNYVVTDGQILGGGLSIRFNNIEKLDVTGQEGNDVFQILSTAPNVITSIYGYVKRSQKSTHSFRHSASSQSFCAI